MGVTKSNRTVKLGKLGKKLQQKSWKEIAAAKVLKRMKKTPARVGVSSIHGCGLIAVRRIAKGERLYSERDSGNNPYKDADGHRFVDVPASAINAMEKNPATRMIAGMAHAYLGENTDDKGKENFWVPETAFDRMHPIWYCNSSKTKQNVKYADLDEFYAGGLIALRDIQPGEELLTNYDELYPEEEETAGGDVDDIYETFPDDKAWVKAKATLDAWRRKAAEAQKQITKAEAVMIKVANQAKKRRAR